MSIESHSGIDPSTYRDDHMLEDTRVQIRDRAL